MLECEVRPVRRDLLSQDAMTIEEFLEPVDPRNS